MSEMKEFSMWLLDNIPDFLMSEPIIYLVGVVVLAFVVTVIFRICRIK